MSTIIQANRQDWNSNGVPANIIVLQQGGILFVNDRVLDLNTGKRYICTVVGTFDNVDTYTGCEFIEDVDERNILSTINVKGWAVNTSRAWTPVSSPAFNTPRSPSATNDVEVLAIVSLTSTLITDAEVDAQIDSGSGYTTVATESLSGLVATTKRTLQFTVPAGASYQFTESGTVAIISVLELPN